MPKLRGFAERAVPGLAVVLSLSVLSARSASAQIPAPAVASSRGYIQGTPLDTHTTGTFDTTASSVLVAFVSTHPSWNSQPVAIVDVEDSVGNTWQVLTGPTVYQGNTSPLLSAIYYVTWPISTKTDTLTVHLTNGAPLVAHVFAISGADISSVPLYSPITDPGVGVTSTDVTSAGITVPANTLLLSWVKNDIAATATALSGYALDPQSTGYLWAESQLVLAPGTYTGHFQYDAAIDWQTAVVGLKTPAGPFAFNQSLATVGVTPVSVVLPAWSPSGAPLTYSVVGGPAHGTLVGDPPNVTYSATPSYIGTDTFTFIANDGTANSNIGTITIAVASPNRPPSATDSTATIAGNSGPVSLIATDPDNDPLTYTVVTPPVHGQLSGTGASRTYTPIPGYIGSDSFTFKVNDGVFDSNIATVTVTVQLPAGPPTISSSVGYVNGTPLTAHTTATFNTSGASTLVAFVSSHPSWNGQPVSFSGVTDNAGNTWNILTGPTTRPDSAFTLMSAIYYVMLPATSATHAVTVNLTNPAPLVIHVFAVSNADITTTPVYSPITDPGAAITSTDVTSAPITVGANTLLLSWVKSESSANATALSGYTLDPQSTTYLWAESQPALVAGSYTGHFQYDGAIDWQTAVVGLKAPSGPVAFSKSVTTFHDMPVAISLSAWSPSGSPMIYSIVTAPANGVLTGTPPILTYTPNSGYVGTDSFTFTANDGSGDSNVATVSLTIRPPDQAPVASDSSVTVLGNAGSVTMTAADPEGDPLTYTIVTQPAHGQLSAGTSATRIYAPTGNYVGPDSFTFKANDGLLDSNVATVSITVQPIVPAPMVVSSRGYINSTALQKHSTASFNTTGASALVLFVSTHPSWNGLPISFSSITDNAGNAWNILTGPTTHQDSTYPLMSAIYYVMAPITNTKHAITVTMNNPAPLVIHAFAVANTDISSLPVYSAITDPGVGNATFDVTSAPISVPANTLLLAWTKNESVANATALSGYVLDPQSTTALWGESQVAPTAGAYTDHFQYDTAIDWQTAIVGLTSRKVSITTPNTAVSWAAGSTRTIAWTHNVGTGQTMDVAFSADNGATWTTLASGVANATSTTGFYTTVMPATLTTQALIRVSPSGHPELGDVSDVPFAIVAPVLTLTAPVTNVSWVGGTTKAITWTHNLGNAEAVRIDVSADGGTTWTTVAANAPNTGNTTGTFNWFVEPPYTSAARVRVTWVANGAATSASPVNFRIVAPIVVTSPNTAVTWAAGTTRTITWTHSLGANQNFDIATSVDNGITWLPMAAGIPAAATTGTFTGLMPSTVTTQALVRVSPAGHPELGDLSNVAFTLAAPSVAVTSPNTAVSWAVGTTHSITWNHNLGTAESVEIDLSEDGGATWTLIAANVLNSASTSGTFNWLITQPVSNTARVRVMWSRNTTVQSASAVNFKIVPPVTGVTPNTGATVGGTAVTISGNGFAAGATVTFGSAPATNVVVVNGTTITATTPPGTPGPVAVTVTNPGAPPGSLANAFTYVIVPTVTAVAPNNGSSAGGTAVTVTGTNFGAGATVTFGGTAATSVVIVNNTTLTAVTPAHAAGTAAVAVTAGGQTGSLANAFTYWDNFQQVAAATPQTASATVTVPYSAPQRAGDMNVVIVGWNDTTASVTSVTDSAGNTYSLAIGPTVGQGLQQSIYVASNVAGSSNTVTVRFSQAATFPDVRILEYRGVTTVDVTAGASGTGTTSNSGVASATNAYEVIVGANVVKTSTGSAGTGFTARVTTSDGDIAEDRIATAAGSVSATATLRNSGAWVMQMVALK